MADGGAGVLPSREELDQLARENRSLREALTAMAVKSGAGELDINTGPTVVDIVAVMVVVGVVVVVLLCAVVVDE